LALGLPLILLLLFGFAVSLDVNKINFAIQDLDRTPTSREYIATSATNQFKLVATGPEKSTCLDCSLRAELQQV